MSNELSSEEYDIIAEHVFTLMLYMVQAVSLNQMKKVKAKDGLFSKIHFYLFFEIIPLFTLHLDRILPSLLLLHFLQDPCPCVSLLTS